MQVFVWLDPLEIVKSLVLILSDALLPVLVSELVLVQDSDPKDLGQINVAKHNVRERGLTVSGSSFVILIEIAVLRHDNYELVKDRDNF